MTNSSKKIWIVKPIAGATTNAFDDAMYQVELRELGRYFDTEEEAALEAERQNELAWEIVDEAGEEVQPEQAGAFMPEAISAEGLAIPAALGVSEFALDCVEYFLRFKPTARVLAARRGDDCAGGVDVLIEENGEQRIYSWSATGADRGDYAVSCGRAAGEDRGFVYF